MFTRRQEKMVSWKCFQVSNGRATLKLCLPLGTSPDPERKPELRTGSSEHLTGRLRNIGLFMSAPCLSPHAVPQRARQCGCSQGARICHYSQGKQQVWWKLSSGINYAGKTTKESGESEVSWLRNYMLQKYLMLASGTQWPQGR